MKSPFPPTPTLRYERMFLAGFACAVGALVGLSFLRSGLQSLAAGLAPGEAAVLVGMSAQALTLLLLGAAFTLLALAFLLFTLIKVQVPNKQQHLRYFIAAQRCGYALAWLSAGLLVGCALLQAAIKLLG